MFPTCPRSAGTSGKTKRLSDRDIRALSTAAAQFPSPALGQEGNLGRNTYDEPGYDNVDLNIAKFFTTPWFFGETMKLEARGEILNLFNRANLTLVSSDMTSGTFGQATNSTRSHRHVPRARQLLMPSTGSSVSLM